MSGAGSVHRLPEPGLFDYLRVIRGRWPLLLIAAVLGGGVGGGMFFWLPPTYEAYAVIAPVSEGKGGALSVLGERFGGLVAGLGESGGGLSDPRQQLAILRSRAFTVRIIEENNLRPRLFPERWDASAQAWIGDAPTLWDAYRKMAHMREITDDRRSGLVRMSIRWRDPEEAARWVELHVTTLNRYLQQRAIEASEKSVAFLTDQVNQTSNVEMRQTLFRLIEAETKKGVLAHATDEFAFAIIDPAEPPDRPDRLSLQLSIAATGIGFLCVAFFGVFLAEYVAAERERRHPPGDA